MCARCWRGGGCLKNAKGLFALMVSGRAQRLGGVHLVPLEAEALSEPRRRLAETVWGLAREKPLPPHDAEQLEERVVGRDVHQHGGQELDHRANSRPDYHVRPKILRDLRRYAVCLRTATTDRDQSQIMAVAFPAQAR
jgi:hypothetical protein